MPAIFYLTEGLHFPAELVRRLDPKVVPWNGLRRDGSVPFSLLSAHLGLINWLRAQGQPLQLPLSALLVR